LDHKWYKKSVVIGCAKSTTKKINKKRSNKSKTCYATHVTKYKGKTRKSKSRMNKPEIYLDIETKDRRVLMVLTLSHYQVVKMGYKYQIIFINVMRNFMAKK
jgi:hypothetical protein